MRVDGQKIRQAREALKARTKGRQGSQSWLAGQIGAHPTSVSDWERGANQPSTRHLRAIALALGVRMEELYADEEEDESVAWPTMRETDLLRVLYDALGRQLERERVPA